MKKIAIYGDSFAQHYDGWPKYLKKISEFKDSEIFVFGVASTSPEYSYSRFLTTHHEYDFIIFLWSCPYRSSLISVDNQNHTVHINFNYREKLKNVYLQAIETSKNNSNVFENIDKNSLKWAKNEWIFLKKFPNKNILFNIAMRDSVKLLRPDAINVECFDFFDKKGLFNVQKNDMLQYSNYFLKENIDIRKNHLTIIQNIEFVKYLSKYIKDENFDIHDTFKEPEKYYTMSKTIEESGFILK